MKTYKLLIGLIIVSNSLFSQNNNAIIWGTVSCDIDSEKVENALVHLKLNNGDSFEHKTNANGEFKFTIKIDTPLVYSISVATDKMTKSKSSNRCGFLATNDQGKGKLEANKEYVKDFRLNRITCCGMYFPRIFFNQNSISICNDSLAKIDSVQFDYLRNSIDFLYTTLKENPTISIELSGHCSNIEKNKTTLSKYRADLIKEILAARGINRERIFTTGWGSKKLLIKNNVIKKAKTKEEKTALHLRNQRVVFRIISWDFKE